jgi:hypothetical protein
MTSRLSAYLGTGDAAVMDEPATAQAMAGFLVRGLHCGALDQASVEQQVGTGLDVIQELAARRVG